jgi:hypothetical protein
MFCCSDGKLDFSVVYKQIASEEGLKTPMQKELEQLRSDAMKN